MPSKHHCEKRAGAPRVGAALFLCLLLSGCGESTPDSETLRLNHQGHRVEVTFYGERSSASLFGPESALTDQVRPLTRRGNPEGETYQKTPQWLDFEYRLDGESRRLLVAKQPIMNQVSWRGIARAGAALGDDSQVTVLGRRYAQTARITDLEGNEYRLRLLRCGRSTMAELSEWNLLIGGVHEGDMDFQGERYGWIHRPYRNQDLKVGFHGSLSWCQEDWEDDNHRVARGYYFVSRFHASPAGIKTDRLFWRPVLELIEPEVEAAPLPEGAQRSPDGHLQYLGRRPNADVFGADRSIADVLGFLEGERIGTGEPDWLVFDDEGRTKLVAAQPIAHSLSWSALARAGLVAGDDSRIRQGVKTYAQDAEVTDRAGHRYRVRLLQCGGSTLDHDAEWNRLMGGVVQPDGDFADYPDLYGWVDEPLSADFLNLGSTKGGATWCRERKDLYGKPHGVNRGFLVPSRYHATDAEFNGWGFGWRPVLERID